MVGWIIILGIHICREDASFQGPEDVWSSESARDKELRICVGADQDDSLIYNYDRGMSTLKVTPLLGLSKILTCPLWASIIFLTIANPRPVPSFLVETKG
jgi:hypothetical protein